MRHLGRTGTPLAVSDTLVHTRVHSQTLMLAMLAQLGEGRDYSVQSTECGGAEREGSLSTLAVLGSDTTLGSLGTKPLLSESARKITRLCYGS